MTIIDTLSDVSSSDSDNPDAVFLDESTVINHVPVIKKRRTRKRKPAKPPDASDTTLLKYWNRRYDLFERFDLGVQLDKESWYSVTPECIARRQSTTCACDFLVDAFSGVGGNAIQFARTCSLVLAIENNYARLLLLKHNAQVYGVANKIMPICGDVVSILRALRVSSVPHSVETSFAHEDCAPESTVNEAPSVKVPPQTIIDYIFMSPPWGGPGYTGVVLPPGSSSWNKRKRRQWFESSEDAIEPTKNLEDIPLLGPALQASVHICQRVLIYLPRSCSIGQMLRLGWPSTECSCPMCAQYRTVSIEEYVVRGRRIALGVHLKSAIS